MTQKCCDLNLKYELSGSVSSGSILKSFDPQKCLKEMSSRAGFEPNEEWIKNGMPYFQDSLEKMSFHVDQKLTLRHILHLL